MKAFERFGLPPFLIQALQKQNIQKPTEIQERLIPAIKNGKDVIGQSQTGSGKTLSFLLPLVSEIDTKHNYTQAVITAPTRELAGQLYDELLKLLGEDKEEKISSRLVVGGTDRLRTMNKLKNQPHIVVGTPGRLHDMVKSQALDVHKTKFYVVDEADQMLDMGFIEQVDQVASSMPEDLQMMVFSATIPEKLQPFLKKYMSQPRHVHVKPEEATPAKIDHYLVPLRHRDRTELTVKVAASLNPYLAIVFTNKKEEADEVFAAMVEEGLNVDLLHGGIAPRQRKQVMKRVNDASVQYLVATDLAARGIDIKGVTHVINYALPKELEFYVHRVGRSARAGHTGEAYTLVEKNEQEPLQKLAKKRISFEYKDLRRGEWVSVENMTVTKKNRTRSTASPAAGMKPATGTKKPKKVKPGYKKKAKQQFAQEAKRQRRIETKRNNKK
ncbi:DEAD/DEAH box helicase [Bacillus sp. FJAT-44742]|uniref:DEAD/DEAH box helicase n=1 Tax=Bacillus sp. FJAT-44742 TaxID=2014005 RepID=UPI000C231527|nr:DEAD/DEAH box helicase [Bacillus sp. FJAT-44742]